jgi:hypothetical protein
MSAHSMLGGISATAENVAWIFDRHVVDHEDGLPQARNALVDRGGQGAQGLVALGVEEVLDGRVGR